MLPLRIEREVWNPCKIIYAVAGVKEIHSASLSWCHGGPKSVPQEHFRSCSFYLPGEEPTGVHVPKEIEMEMLKKIYLFI